MKKYCYLISDDTLMIVPKYVLDKDFNLEIKKIKDNLSKFKKNSDRYSEIVEEIEDIKRQYEEISKSTKIPKEEFKNVAVLSSSLIDKGFLNKHTHVFENKNVKVCLNDFTNEYRNKIHFDHSDENYNEIRKDKEIFDISVSYKEQDLEKRETELIDFCKKVKFKSLKFKENFDSENEYTFNELDNARDRINQVATIINSYKDLSQYEKVYLAFSYVQSYEYKKSGKGEPIENSRALLHILNSDEIVCAGKANLFKAICDKIGVSCIYRVSDGHALNTIAINDPKYSMYGIFNLDATNQTRDCFVLSNEDIPVYKDIFVPIDWMAKISKKERDYLFENSGLNNVSQSIINSSAKEFEERDKNLEDEFLRITLDSMKDISLSHKEVGLLRYETLSYGDTVDLLNQIKTIMQQGKLDEYKASAVFKELSDEIYSNSNSDLDLNKDYSVSDLCNSLENLKKIKNFHLWIDDEKAFAKFSPKAYELICKNCPDKNLDAIQNFAKEYEQNIISNIENMIEVYNEKKGEIDLYLQGINEKRGLLKKQVIPVGKRVENLANSLIELQHAHVENNREVPRAIIVGAQIDGAKTTTYPKETQAIQEEQWKKFASDMGYDPNMIIPTAEKKDFSQKDLQ